MKAITAILVGLSVVWGATDSRADVAAAQPIYTKQTRFRIPYRYDAAEMQRLEAREIRLYVSYDQGRDWQHVQTVVPSQGRFDFQAPRDGEYWFAVRTLDGNGQLHPQGEAIEPGLKVVVDTQPPLLELTLTQMGPGKVRLSWNASDVTLDSSQLRLEYLQAGLSDWQQVIVVPQPAGQTAWSVPQGGFVAVRGTVADLAANVGSAQARIELPASEEAAPQPALPMTRPAFPQPAAPMPQPGIPDFRQPIATPEQYPSSAIIADNRSLRPNTLQGRYPTPLATPASQGPAHVRVVNSRRFQIGYQIEDVGPSGVGAVELYITQDQGQKWWKYGNDADLQSPFEVDVPQDGTYGFAIRVRSGVGLAADPPQNGNRPPIVVVVDQTPPHAHLMPIQHGQGGAWNKILLRWKVGDDNPAERPVALYYAANSGGPWEPISDWHEDRGSFLWTVGPGVPARLYVRLAARDAAGNITQVETPQPIIVDLSRPSARIVDIESVITPTTQR